MKRCLFLAFSLLMTPSLTLAHVSVRPRESKALAEELYTVRVPTEGSVATTHVISSFHPTSSSSTSSDRRRDLRGDQRR